MPRLFIQLGIECDHATIGVFQFAVEADQLLLPLVQLPQGSEQFQVLLSDLFDGILRFMLPQLLDDFLQCLARNERRSRGKNLRQSYHALLGYIRSDLALINYAPGRDECRFPLWAEWSAVPASARTNLGACASRRANGDEQYLWRGSAFELKVDASA